MAEAGLWWALAGSRVRAQLSYRRSFALDCVGQLALVGLDLVEVIALTGQVPAIAGWDRAQLVLLFGLAQLGFATGDVVVGQVDRISVRVRAGTLDILLVRPLPVLAQLAVDDLQLRRLVRVATAGLLFGVGLHLARPVWTPGHLLLVVLSPVCGAVVFGSLFVVAGAANIRLVEGGEFTNALTYGSAYLSGWPTSVLGLVLGRFFTFVVPAAFVAYLPAAALLGKPAPLGLPTWLVWLAPVAAAWSVLAAALAWKTALRWHTGAGG